MRLLITRPKPDADDLAKVLRELGHKVLISPVIKFDWIKVTMPPPTRISGLIITSRNALRSLEKWHDLTPYTSLPLFAIGPGSAQFAKKRGFTHIIEGAGQAQNLPKPIKQHIEAAGAPLYHPTGRKKAFDLAPPLTDMGYQLIEQTVYESLPVTRLAPAVRKALEKSTLDGVILLSPRTAKLFARLIKNNKLREEFSQIICYCLSQNVADELGKHPVKNLIIARQADLGGIIDLL